MEIIIEGTWDQNWSVKLSIHVCVWLETNLLSLLRECALHLSKVCGELCCLNISSSVYLIY